MIQGLLISTSVKVGIKNKKEYEKLIAQKLLVYVSATFLYICHFDEGTSSYLGTSFPMPSLKKAATQSLSQFFTLVFYSLSLVNHCSSNHCSSNHCFIQGRVEHHLALQKTSPIQAVWHMFKQLAFEILEETLCP